MKVAYSVVISGIVVSLILIWLSSFATKARLGKLEEGRKTASEELHGAQERLDELERHLDRVKAAIVTEKLAKGLMGKSVRIMTVDELVLLMRTPRSEEAAAEIGRRRAAVLKQLPQPQAKEKK